MHTFKTLCILDVLFYIAYSARYSLFVLMCRKTHITHSLIYTIKLKWVMIRNSRWLPCPYTVKNIYMPSYPEPGVVGWYDGAGQTSSAGASYSLDCSRARAYCACSRCGWGLFGRFYSHLSFSLLFLPLFGRWPDIY